MGQVVAKKVEHFDDCVKAFAQYEKEKAEFERMFPNYCRACGGWGGHSYRYDPSPAGVSLSRGYMEDWDPCAECVEKGKCPHCAGEIVDRSGDGDWACPKCGWSEVPKSPVGQILANGLPEEPECWCDYRRVQGTEDAP
jgi:hypothetical protein